VRLFIRAYFKIIYICGQICVATKRLYTHVNFDKVWVCGAY
jgi:hypothetical protein